MDTKSVIIFSVLFSHFLDFWRRPERWGDLQGIPRPVWRRPRILLHQPPEGDQPALQRPFHQPAQDGLPLPLRPLHREGVQGQQGEISAHLQVWPKTHFLLCWFFLSFDPSSGRIFFPSNNSLCLGLRPGFKCCLRDFNTRSVGITLGTDVPGQQQEFKQLTQTIIVHLQKRTHFFPKILDCKKLRKILELS